MVSIFLPRVWMPSPTLEEGAQRASQVSNTVEGSGASSGDSARPGGDSKGGEPNPVASREAVEPDAGRESSEADAPENKTLKVSIPGMSRVEGDTVPSTTGGDKGALKKNVAIHLEGTGFPWQQEANVYMAGHRIGFPGTDSFLGFYDLNKLEQGDKIKVTDADGNKYTYRVYRQEIVKPTNMDVTQPVENRNILTLQTCTLPNYTQRLIVQAEKVA